MTFDCHSEQSPKGEAEESHSGRVISISDGKLQLLQPFDAHLVQVPPFAYAQTDLPALLSFTIFLIISTTTAASIMATVIVPKLFKNQLIIYLAASTARVVVSLVAS